MFFNQAEALNTTNSLGRRPGWNFAHLKTYGPETNMILDPLSSGDESDEDSAGPSGQLVADTMLDSSML